MLKRPIKIGHNPMQVFTFCTNKHRVEDYPFTWKTNSAGIPIEVTDWCMVNCKSDWGWWFNLDSIGIMGFMDRDEMISAMLRNMDLIDTDLP